VKTNCYAKQKPFLTGLFAHGGNQKRDVSWSSLALDTVKRNFFPPFYSPNKYGTQILLPCTISLSQNQKELLSAQLR